MNNSTSKLKKIYFIILCVLVSMFSFPKIQAQYTFSALTGTFTPLTGGTVVSAIQTDDALSGFINLGFSFKYNGKPYTQMRVSSNGFITFRVTALSVTYPYLATDSLIVGILNGDLSGSVVGAASYKTEGSAPNRIFTMECLNWKWNYTATQAGISFQAKFYETSNRIEFIYRQESGALVSPNATIGLSFHQTGKFMALTDISSSPSISTTSAPYFSTKPASNQLYRFDELISPKSDNHVTGFSSVAPGSIQVKWADATGTNLPTRYLIKASNVSFAAITDPVDGTEITQDLDLKDGVGAVYVDYGKQKFTGWTDSLGNTAIYMKIFPVSNYNSNTRYKTDGTVPQLQIDVPFYQARNLTFSNINSASVTLNWVRGSGSNCIVFAKENGTGTASPVNNSTYTGNTIYGSGTQIGSSGWFCIYNGPANTVTVTGLKLLTNYAFHVVEYTGAAGAEQYSTVNETSGHIIQSSNMFTEQTGISLMPMNYSAAAWGDYDNDGNLDVMITGYNGTNYLSKLYKNNGNNTFTEQTGITLTGVDGGQIDWGDYDKDGYLDILYEGYTGSNPVTKIYHNNGNNTFTEQTGIALTGLYLGSCVWGDYDNDGYLDILLTGYDGTSPYSKIYHNNRNNSFSEQTNISLTGVHQGKSTWVDYDNDGDLDIILTGFTKSTYVSKLYRNNGDNTFTEQTGITLTGVYYSDVAFGDYDNDGYPDLLLAGSTGGSIVSKIYHNNGNNTFTEQTAFALTGVYNCSVSWIDFDNDGNLDAFISGNTNNTRVSKIYKNNGNNTFTEQTSVYLPGIDLCSASWADYDNDGDLDVLVLGTGATAIIAKIFRNDNSVVNVVPQAPTGLKSAISSIDMVLGWNPVKTDATPFKALSYNIRIGKTSGASDILVPNSSSTGFRKIVGIGNAQLDTSYAIRNLKKGTYYWSVQAIDNAYAGGTFATEQTFIYNVDVQAKALKPIIIKSNSLKLQWFRGNGDKCAVFMKENGTDNAMPVNNSTYTANVTFGLGTQIGATGWYCVYNGTLDTITVNNLKSNTGYRIQVIEFEGVAGSEIYNTTSSAENLITQITNLFTDLTGTSLTAFSYTAAAWGDYDNDGDLDVVITGSGTSSSYTTKLYKNNGNNTFTEQTGIVFTGVYFGSCAWGDYDNDGYLDLLYNGYSSSGPVSKIYHNNGNNTFTEQTGILLAGVSQGSCSWGDYDNDGYLDILLTGYGSSSALSKIYRNNGGNNFIEQTGISLPGVYQGSSKWIDYDNDGNLDIFLSGYTTSSSISTIYRNNGDNTFTEQTSISLPKIYNDDVAFGDYDNDGYLDILLAGNSGSTPLTKIYHNNGNNTYTEQTAIALTGVSNCSVSWSDYDNDGDLDVFISGNTGTTRISKIYKNNGDNTFTEQPAISLTGVDICSSTWADVDNDGDLDLLILGNTASGKIVKVYRNEMNVANIVPQAPTGLTSNTNNDDMVLRWNPVKTDATPYKALSYNVRIGKTTGASDIVACHSSSSGFRKIVGIGNTQLDTSYVIANLKKGTYYWSVQAIDNSYAGGTFATEQTFVYNVDVQASAIKLNSTTFSSIKLQWIRGNGDKCAVFAKERGLDNAIPVNNTTYAANVNYGSGTQIGSTGWYCVYNGVKDTMTINNLTANADYRFQVIEYTGLAGSETYYTSTGTNNPVQYAPAFTEQTQVAITGISGKVEAWGDYNKDGYLDLFMAGNDGSSSIAKLYKNNADNTFTEVTTATFSIGTAYDATWCDYDNDGDMDILIAGLPNSQLYTNNGDGTFTLKTQLPSIFMGKSAWADFNNDGFKDIILTGSSDTKILKNNQDGTFTAQIDTLPSLSNYSSVACGDYDNDGDQDILLAGYSNDASVEVTKVFRNDGNFIFTEQKGIVLPGISNCSVAWADMDNDGDLDIILSGGGFDLYSKIYDNNGNNTFTELTSTPLKGLYRSSLAIADYDNDGYRDLMVSGSVDGSDYYSLVYHNNGNKTYSESTTLSFPGIQFGSVNWGDYDSDGDLDLFLCGTSATGKISKLYRNNSNIINAAPYVPYGLSTTLAKNDAKLTWSKTSDDKTGQNGLSYNLYVYDISKTGYMESPSAFTQTQTPNGLRLVASEGDIRYSSNGYTIKGLPAGNYKWSIQAVDAGLKGGSFASESSFSIVDLSAVSINLVTNQLTGTTSNMQYCLNSTDGINGVWNYCYSPNTTVNFATGGYDVWIRQQANTTNNRKVGTIAAQQSAPIYDIDYINETTDKIIAATDEYSANSSMSTATSGADAKITITPGQNLYIRTMGNVNTLPSAIKTLTVPARPAAPTFSIDYVAEGTLQIIPSTVEYSTSSTMSGAISGKDSCLALTPGQSAYFRTKATATAFKSNIQTLTSPTRPVAPNFTIDYINETTTQTVSSGYEYSPNLNMSSSIAGLDTKLTIVPGQTLYFRAKATVSAYKSNIQTLVIPARPAAPSNFVINDITNAFDWTYTGYNTVGLYEYSTNSGSTWTGCVAKPTNVGNVNIDAGALQLRIIAASTRFKSDALVSTSAFSINTGITNLEEAGIKMYPNPVSDILIIDGLKEQSKITISDIHGKLIKTLELQNHTERLDVNYLPQGMYILKIENSAVIAESKFIKQ